jgi:hypothetical protein
MFQRTSQRDLFWVARIGVEKIKVVAENLLSMGMAKELIKPLPDDSLNLQSL